MAKMPMPWRDLVKNRKFELLRGRTNQPIMFRVSKDRSQRVLSFDTLHDPFQPSGAEKMTF